MKGAILLALLPLGLGCSGLDEKVERAVADGNHDQAVDLLWGAAVESSCPDRGRHLLRRAEVQQLVARDDEAMESIEKAISACPDLKAAYWARAQRHAASGNREAAISDAREAGPAIPHASALEARLVDELAGESRKRQQASLLVEKLRSVLDTESGERAVADTGPALLARQVPIPIRLQYEVIQDVSSPLDFQMAWTEHLSYRGDANANSYMLVRWLDIPPINRSLPMYYRLLMSNQRLPMRFLVSSRGEVSETRWHRDGPNRGMRPDMLRPEIQGMLKRRRLYDPGGSGTRKPGETWTGEDTRIVDGRPVHVRYSSKAQGWVDLHGVRTFHTTSEVSGDGYSGTEETWLHPATSVPVKWRREGQYIVTSNSSIESWQEVSVGTLVSLSGSN